MAGRSGASQVTIGKWSETKGALTPAFADELLRWRDQLASSTRQES